MPSTMASAAPKPAAAETPSVNGLASGLFRMVCIHTPGQIIAGAQDRLVPPSNAV